MQSLCFIIICFKLMEVNKTFKKLNAHLQLLMCKTLATAWIPDT